MSRAILNGLTTQYKTSTDFFDSFIKSCPDDIWGKTSGRFPVWQIVWHALFCIPFFLGPKDADSTFAFPYNHDVLLFKDLNQPPADKAATAACSRAMQDVAQKYFASLTDADLSREHEGFSFRLNKSHSHAQTIAALIGHNMYHFGMCDAALRANGLEGLF